MRILKASFIMVVFTTFVLASFSFAADTKIGIFDFAQIMKDSKAGRSAKAKYEKKGKALMAVLERKQKELKKMKAKLEKDRNVMDEGAFRKKVSEYQKKAIDIKELDRKSQEELRNFQAKIVSEVNVKLVKILNKIGKKGKYAIILEKQLAGVSYFKKDIDLTKKIVKELNSQ